MALSRNSRQLIGVRLSGQPSRSQWTFIVGLSFQYPLRSNLIVVALCSYLEGHGMDSNLYAWGWILLMFVGPTLVTFTEEWYQWIVVRCILS